MSPHAATEPNIAHIAPVPTIPEAERPREPSQVTDQEIAVLESIQRKLLWLSTLIIHHANHARPNPDGTKVGGHQASSASVVSIMTALYFHFMRAGDRIAVKPHASPVFHSAMYLLGALPRGYLTTLRQFGGLQAYPEPHEGRRTPSTSRPARSGSARSRRRSPRWRSNMPTRISATRTPGGSSR